MSKWKEVIEEKNTQAFKDRVKNAVAPIISENGERFQVSKKSEKSSFWLYFLLPTAAACGLAVLVFLKPQSTERQSSGLEIAARQDAAKLVRREEIAKNYVILKDLQVIKNLELLTAIGDPDKWPKKKT